MWRSFSPIITSSTPCTERISRIRLAADAVSTNTTDHNTVGSTPIFINFDLNAMSSITISGTSATITPTFTETTTTVNQNEDNENDDDGEIEDVHGTVTSLCRRIRA